MADPLEVILKIVNANAVKDALKDSAKSAQTMADNYDKADKAAKATADAVDKAAKAAKFSTGPYQKIVDLQEQLNRAKEKGNTLAQKDIELQLQRQRKLIDRIENPPQSAVKAAAIPRGLRERMLAQGPWGRLNRLQGDLDYAKASGNAGATHDIQYLIDQQKKRIQSITNPQGPKPKPEPGYAEGPYQRLERYKEQLNRAKTSGNKVAEKDLAYMVARQQKAVDKLDNPKQPQSKFMQAILSSRVGFGGGGVSVMPLVGRSLAALAEGGGAAAGLAGVAIAGGAAALAIWKLADSAAEGITAFAKLRYSTGGTAVETAQLKRMAGALGMDPEAMGSISDRIQSALEGGGMSRVFAMSAGAFNMPRPFGAVDEAKNVLNVAKGLRGMDRDTAIRTAREIGVPELLPLLDMSNERFAKFEAESNADASAFDNNRSAMKYNATKSNFMDNLDRVKVQMGTPVMNYLAAVMNNPLKFSPLGLAYHAAFDKENETFALKAAPSSVSGFGIGGEGFAKGAAGFFGQFMPDSAREAVTKALDENSNALHMNTSAISDLASTMTGTRTQYGQGERLNGALPDSLNGNALRRALVAGGLSRLSQF